MTVGVLPLQSNSPVKMDDDDDDDDDDDLPVYAQAMSVTPAN